MRCYKVAAKCSPIELDIWEARVEFVILWMAEATLMRRAGEEDP